MSENGTRHVWSAAKSYCKEDIPVLPKPDPNDGEHTYGDWTVIRASSCTETSTDERECVFCDHKEIRTTKALGYTKGAEADCMNDQTCTVCGEVLAACLDMITGL